MTSSEVIEQAEPHFKRFIYGALIAIAFLGVIFLTQLFPSLRIPFVFIIPFILIGGIIQMIVLYRQGQSNLPPFFFTVGVISILGGALFDMIITVIKSPTLELEGNLIARSLLDSGYSIGFVYGYGILAQALLIILGCAMWASLLRHRETIVASANYENVSYLDFFKASHGGENLSWRQFIFPIKISESPKKYYMGWFFVVVWVGAIQARWYLGLEWLNVVNGNRTYVALLLIMLFVIGYEVWLFIRYRSAQKKLSKNKTS
jgi:hypothetical protein